MSRDSKTAIAYLRRSTDKQETSLVQQLDWAVAEAKRLGLSLMLPDGVRTAIQAGMHGRSQLGGIYLDDAISGSDRSRPGFNAMLARLKDDKSISHLLVWDRSRFGRFERSEVGSGLEKDVREWGVTIVLHNATLGPRRISDGSLPEDIVAQIDHMSSGKMRIDLAENVLRGQTRIAKDGLWNGGPTPYGFHRVLVNLGTKAYEVIPEGTKGAGRHGYGVAVVPGTDEESLTKLRAVKFIAETYNEGHLGLHLIAKALNKQGLPSPYAGRTRTNRDGVVYEVPGKWTINSVRGILENPIYSGKMAYGRRGYGSVRRFDPDSITGYRHVENEERIEGTNRARAKEERDPSRWLQSTPAIPFVPIVPLGLWEANQQRLRTKGNIGGQRGRPKCADANRFPVQVVCGDCGQRMVGHQHSGGLLVFKCSTWLNSGCEKCHPNWVARNEIVIFALEALRREFRRLVDPAVFKAEVGRALDRAKSNRTEMQARLNMTQVRLGNIQLQLDRARKAYLDAPTEAEAAALEAGYKEKVRQSTEAERDLRDLEVEMASLGIPVGDEVERTIEYLKDLDRLLDDMPEDSLRTVFDAVGARIEVQFAPNPAKGRRHRVPVGGTLAFGVGADGRKLPRNAEPSAVAEGSGPRIIGFGCGGWI